MKVLITGVNGQVGSALVHQAKTLGHEVVEITREKWDMGKSPAYGKELVLNIKPDLVINPAAYTNVDEAEDDEATAFKVNKDAPRSLAKACNQLNIPLMHISTDFIFDGTKEEPYVETDTPNPINVYGRTKLAGELAIQEEADKFIILRTSWVFSKDGKNFVNTILRLAKEHNEIKVVNDQFGGPTNADSIANVLLKLATQQKKQWGIYHFSGLPYVSWYDFAKTIILHGVKMGTIVNPPEIKPCWSYEFPTKAKRPQNSRLTQEKNKIFISNSQSNWQKYFT